MKKLIILTLGALISCGELKEIGPAGGSGVDLVPANVQSIFDEHCIACHSGSSAPFSQDLSEGAAYSNIVNVTSSESGTLKRVHPGDTTNSYIRIKIRGIGVNRMPDGGPYLSAGEIQTILDWIQQGAPAR